ncbi:MAG: hypothetical protein P8N72_19180 [Flavimaricola sp.]|nr:hypothetical protein [Flavimaricola sp.]
MFLINTPRLIVTQTSLWKTGLVVSTNPDLQDSFAKAIIADSDDQLEMLRQWHLRSIDMQNTNELEGVFDVVVSTHLVPKMDAWLAEGEELCVQCNDVKSYRIWKENGEVIATQVDVISSEFIVSATIQDWLRMMILPEFIEGRPQ